MIRCFARYVLFVWLMLAPLAASLGQDISATQYQLKAVFLYNFTQFVEWPAGSFGSPDEPFIIGVYGPNVFGSYLDEAVRNEKAGGHPIQIITVASAADAGRCQLLYINRIKAGELESILKHLKGRSTLTVGEHDDFCNSGGIISFVHDRNKIRLRINVDAAQAARLKISSKLLRLAEVVNQRM